VFVYFYFYFFAFIFLTLNRLAIYLNRRYQGTYSQGGCGKDALSSEKLKKLNIVSPIRRLDQWWPGVKDTLGLQGAVDNNHFVWYTYPLSFCLTPFHPILKASKA
jgi:hypothetical protein